MISGEVEKAYSFSYHQVPVEGTVKLGICPVRRRVSRDTDIDHGNGGGQANSYCIFTANILTQFLYSKQPC